MICKHCREQVVLDISQAPPLRDTFPTQDWTGEGAGYEHFEAWVERLADHKAEPERTS